MTTFTTQDLTTEQQVALQKHEEMHTMVNTIIERQSNWVDPSPLPQPPAPPKPDLDEILNAISAQLYLLASVIKESAEKGKFSDGNPSQSLQECVSTTLQQAEWFKEMVDEKAEELVDDKDFDYQIESAVESHFSNSFSLDDHVDITAEVESKVEDIADDLIKDAVEERLEEIVRNKLQNIRITFD
jgi:hypothetical protein